MERKAPTAIVHFDDLIKDPIGTMEQAFKTLDIPVRADEKGEIPSFAELNRLFPQFFNSGKSGRWKSEMNPEVEELFWQTHGETMTSLGYERSSF